MKFSDLIIGGQNRKAIEIAQEAAECLGKHNPLTVWGPTGTGKTALLQCIESRVRELDARKRILHLTPESFFNLYISALEEELEQAFIGIFYDIDLLLFDDIGFLQGKSASQEAVASAINTVLHDGGQVVVASEYDPALMPHLFRNIDAKGNALTIELTKFTESMAKTVIQEEGSRHHISITDEWLQRVSDPNFWTMQGVVSQVMASQGKRNKLIVEKRRSDESDPGE